MIRLQEILKKVDVFLYPEDSVLDAAEKLLCSPSEAIPVVDPRGTFLGAVTRDHLLQMVLRKLPLHAPIKIIFRRMTRLLFTIPLGKKSWKKWFTVRWKRFLC